MIEGPVTVIYAQSVTLTSQFGPEPLFTLTFKALTLDCDFRTIILFELYIHCHQIIFGKNVKKK